MDVGTIALGVLLGLILYELVRFVVAVLFVIIIATFRR